MNYWEEVMQDDAHIVTIDGWKAGKEVVRLQKESKGKKQDVEGLPGLEGRLIPTELLIKTFFAKEQQTLEELNATLEQTSADMEALVEEHGGEEGLLSEVVDNDKIAKADVLKRCKDIKNSADDGDELEVLEQCLALFEKQANTKKAIKAAEKDLEGKVLAQYPKLSEGEVKTLVVERKWMDEIAIRVLGEIDRLAQTLAERVKELAERYDETLPELTERVEELTVTVEKYLKKMGFAVKQP
jgi:type I restriction enzyme M protein